ncbi:MAG: ABC transporter permease [bacterium]|nr:ABC transporter permease [bacterium]
MGSWIAFSSILGKDIRTYYAKPPNISWGIVFPLAWSVMFFVKSSTPVDVRTLLPGLVVLSVLFGTTSMLAVTITFERRRRSFERLLLAPMSLTSLMLAKTSGAILFGVFNAFVPVVLARLLIVLPGVNWIIFLLGVLLLAMASTFLGLLVAVSVSEVFEAQTFSNFFRFPMIFLSGMFLPVQDLPHWLRPVSSLLPPTYGVDLIRQAVTGQSRLNWILNATVLSLMVGLLLAVSIRQVKRRWIM